jgi:hypothetical protein
MARLEPYTKSGVTLGVSSKLPPFLQLLDEGGMIFHDKHTILLCFKSYYECKIFIVQAKSVAITTMGNQCHV